MSPHSRIARTLLLAPLVLAAEATAQSRMFTPGGVDRIPAPPGSVDALHALHFTLGTDLDAVALIGGEVFLLHMPSRHRRFYSMGGGEAAIGIVPGPGEQDAVVAAGLDGLSVRTRSTGTPFYTKVVLNGSQAWKDVDRLWVYPEGGGSIVYGRNSVTGGIVRASYSPPAGPQSAQEAWTVDPTDWVPAYPEELVRMEYSSSHTGLETAYRYPDQAFLLNQTTNPFALLWYASTAATDRIEPLHFAGTAQGHTFDDWSLLVLDGPPSAQALYAGNGDGAVVGGGLLPANRTYTDVRSARLSVSATTTSDEVLLPETADGYITVRVPQIQPYDPIANAYPVGFGPWNGTDTIETYEFAYTGTRSAVRCFAAGDFDLDGDTDLLVAHEGAQDLRLWLNPEILSEDYRVACFQISALTETGSGANTIVKFPVVKPSGIQDHGLFQYQLWLQASSTSEPVKVGIPVDESIPSTSEKAHDVEVTYDSTQLTDQRVLWLAIAAIERDSTQKIVRRWPTRHLFHSPSSNVEGDLGGRYYPCGEGSNCIGGTGDPTGYRKGTSSGGGGNPTP